MKAYTLANGIALRAFPMRTRTQDESVIASHANGSAFLARSVVEAVDNLDWIARASNRRRDRTHARHVPFFVHDCDVCRFLGRYTYTTDRGSSLHDLWYCPKDLLGPTVIARYGDEGSHYTSGIPIALMWEARDPKWPLVEALRRTRAQRLPLA